MKRIESVLSALVLVTPLAAGGAALAADEGVVLKQEQAAGSYCHMKFPAIRRSTLGDDQPELNDPSSSNAVDFYGPCDEDPTGKDQIETQRLEQQHRMEGSTAGESGRFD
jgi:hypothetical protein